MGTLNRPLRWPSSKGLWKVLKLVHRRPVGLQASNAERKFKAPRLAAAVSSPAAILAPAFSSKPGLFLRGKGPKQPLSFQRRCACALS
jgi:hypothetical protein